MCAVSVSADLTAATYLPSNVGRAWKNIFAYLDLISSMRISYGVISNSSEGR